MSKKSPANKAETLKKHLDDPKVVNALLEKYPELEGMVLQRAQMRQETGTKAKKIMDAEEATVEANIRPGYLFIVNLHKLIIPRKDLRGHNIKA